MNSTACRGFRVFWVVAVLLCNSPASGVYAATKLTFNFGGHAAISNEIPVTPDMIYTTERGFGFEPGAAVILSSNGVGTCCTSEHPFFFSARLPEGNYRVTVTFGNPVSDTTNTLKAELRRLMLERVETRAGQYRTQSCLVNIRTPRIAGGGQVRLKERERTSEIWAWDEKLTLEFNGTRPSLAALTIEPAPDVPTLYLLGDSTVCDQPTEPWNSWGQMITRFFKPTIAVANHAESGETLKNSLAAKRLEKVLSLIRPGDYLMIQYGHNDMKDRATNALASYESNLKRFVTAARAKGAKPVLITSMERKAGLSQDTLLNYPDIVRNVAREQGVALIDLHAISKQLYRALGPDLDKAFQDGTHHNAYGSYLLAKCIVREIKTGPFDLAAHVTDDFAGFDVAHPDPVASFVIPASPGQSGAKPLGD